MNEGLSGTSAGRQFSLLVVGRVSLLLGDPELKKYSIAYDVNFFNKRKGISLDFYAARQGGTDLFNSSAAFGPGLLLNWGPLNIDGEWIWMQRGGERMLADSSLRKFTAKAGTGHACMDVNLPTGALLLEPTFMVMKFQGQKMQ